MSIFAESHHRCAPIVHHSKVDDSKFADSSVSSVSKCGRSVNSPSPTTPTSFYDWLASASDHGTLDSESPHPSVVASGLRVRWWSTEPSLACNAADLALATSPLRSEACK